MADRVSVYVCIAGCKGTTEYPDSTPNERKRCRFCRGPLSWLRYK